MKKLLTLVLCWLIAFTAMAETTFKAKTAASVAGGYVTSLNKVDGSFEDGTAGWIASTDNIVQTASTEFQGNYKGVWSGTGAGTLDLQWTATSSNTYEASAQVNVRGKNNVYVCAYVGPTETGCKLIPALNKIQKVSVVADSILSSAFNLRLKHTGSDAFSIDVDDGKIEPWTPQAVNLQNDEYLGTLTTTGSWSSNTTYVGKYWRRGDMLIGDVTVSVSGAPTSTTLTVTLPSSLSIDTSKLSDPTSAGYNIVHGGITSIFDIGTKTWTTSGVAFESTTLIKPLYDVGDGSSTGISQAAPITFANGDKVRMVFQVPIVGWSVSRDNIIQSWQDGMASWSATSTIQIGATTTAPTKGTTDLDQVKWIKRGESAEFWYQYNQVAAGSGAAGSGDYLFSLPSGMQFADHVTKYTTIEGGGSVWSPKTTIPAGVVSSASGDYAAFVLPYDSTKFRVGIVGGSEVGYVSVGVVGSAYVPLSSASVTFSLKFSAPIQGWSAAPTLLALPTSKNQSESAVFSNSGAISIASVSSDWISSISRSGVGTGTIDYTKLNLTKAPALFGTDLTGNGRIISFSSVTATSAAWKSESNSGSAADGAFSIKLQKQLPDYTAPGVFISNLNPDGFNRTTGTTGLIDNFSFSYGTTNATTVCSASPCSYLDQIGSYVSSVTRSGAGSYTANFSKTFSKVKCTISVGRYVLSTNSLSCSSCSSLSFATENATTTNNTDSYSTLMCQGY